MEPCLSPGKIGTLDDVLFALSLDPHVTLTHRPTIALSDFTTE
jgi:hypothetical protein